MRTTFYVANNTADLDTITQWTGSQPDAIQLHGGYNGWSDWLGSVGWIDRQFTGVEIDTMWAIPLIPYGANLAQAAVGAYDDKYLAMARQLVAVNEDQDQIYVRLGWEFNGLGWNSSSAVGQAGEYAAAFRKFVDICRSVSDRFVFEWCPNIGKTDMSAETAYPGDDYVDVIGIDFYYNTAWHNPDGALAFEHFVRQDYGLQWHQDFAAEHGKPTAIAEWGLNSDSPEFVRLVAQWAENHDMVYANYWDSNAAFPGQLSEGQYPQAAAAFLEAFDYVEAGESTARPADRYGSDGDDFITGTAEADVIDGGRGADRMTGGDGDDVYYVDNAGDLIVEWYNAGKGGTDTVYSSVSYKLADKVENLTLLGEEGIIARGNASANVLTGNAGNNFLDGDGGSDTLRGAAGDDHLMGGAGNDMLDGGTGADIVDGGDGDDTLLGGEGNDRLLGGNGRDLLRGGAGTDRMEGGNGDDTYYVDDAADSVVEWYLGGKGGNDLVYASVSYALPQNVEKLILTGTAAIDATGSKGADSLHGNEAANLIAGLDGDDRLYGNGGDDTLRGGNGRDELYGGTGHDRLFGDAGDDLLVGGEGADFLDGGYGKDRLEGGNGDDTYVVDSVEDLVVEWAANGLGGTDTVQAHVSYTLGANLENMVLLGTGAINATGNAQGNMLSGNGGANVLDGRDGDDLLRGYEGDDLLLGGEGNDRLDGGAGNDRLVAGEGADFLDGGDGEDRMEGGNGDDTYVIDSAGDVAIEWFGFGHGGHDTVEAGISWALGDNFEDLVLLGDGDLSATGNRLDNLIRGNDGDNLVVGAGGNDVLYGGAGADRFVFAKGDGRDTIMDFATGDVLDMSALVKAAGEPSVWSCDGSTFIGCGSDVVELAGIAAAQLYCEDGLFYLG